jgi:hypothetical protein
MEILDGAYPLLQSISSGSDPKEMFKDCDVVSNQQHVNII